MTADPLIKKLRIKPGQKIAIVNAPPGYVDSLGGLPEGVLPDPELRTEYDLIHAFYNHWSVLDNQLDDFKSALIEDGILWISYPKQSAKRDTDLNRDILRVSYFNQGLKAVSHVSVDDTWSALRFRMI